MTHGSRVTYSVHPTRRHPPSVRAARRRTSASACAIGSRRVSLRLCPRAITRPSTTTTAPIGTSPRRAAAFASSIASPMNAASEVSPTDRGRLLRGGEGRPFGREMEGLQGAEDPRDGRGDLAGPVAVDQFVLLEHDARLDAGAVDRGGVLAREVLLEADAGHPRFLRHRDDGAPQPHDVGGNEEAVHHDLRDQLAKDLDLLMDGAE